MRTILILWFSLLALTAPAYALDYYVDAIKGNDSSPGTDMNLPWKTIARVNALKLNPGDRVKFKRGAEWRESLIISASGVSGNEIVFTAYGDGPNPVIKCSDTFADWRLDYESKGIKVWKGTIPGIRNSWGAMREGARVPSYMGYPDASQYGRPKQISDMQNGFFYAPLNSSTFHYRYDQGNPGSMEVGARRYGIYVNYNQYIIIDGIDVHGPRGLSDRGSSTGELMAVKSSQKITIRNCTIAHSNSICINITKGSYNCSLINIRAFDSASTPVYFSEAGEGNRIVNSEVYNSGNLVTDYGDMGLIGVWKTPGVLIEKCYLHDNGHKGAAAIDAAVSIVESPLGTLLRSVIVNAGGTAVMFAENSDHGTAAYNIIDHWGVYGKGITKWPSIEGLRIGGGETQSTARGCSILNNLFVHGGTARGEYAALRINFRLNAGLLVKNNIFLNNQGVYEIYAESRDNFKNWSFSNNCYYRTSGNSIKIGQKIYAYDHVVGKEKGFYSYDQKQESGSIIGDPGLSPDLRSLQPGSPCIDKGVFVGLHKDFHGNDVPPGRVNIGPFEQVK